MCIRKVLALISFSALFKLFWPKQCHKKGPIVTHSLLYKIRSIFQKAIMRADVPCCSKTTVGFSVFGLKLKRILTWFGSHSLSVCFLNVVTDEQEVNVHILSSEQWLYLWLCCHWGYFFFTNTTQRCFHFKCKIYSITFYM